MIKKELHSKLHQFCKRNQIIFPNNKLVNFLIREGKNDMIYLTRKDIVGMQKDGKELIVKDTGQYFWYLRIKKKDTSS